jgi:hypothetical protein
VDQNRLNLVGVEFLTEARVRSPTKCLVARVTSHQGKLAAEVRGTAWSLWKVWVQKKIPEVNRSMRVMGRNRRVMEFIRVRIDKAKTGIGILVKVVRIEDLYNFFLVKL